VISIDTLPDDALLEIFDHYMYGIRPGGGTRQAAEEKAWQSLVHVCHRWRSIVFESPNRLNLRLVCTGRTPARDTLDVWPTLPLLILADFVDPIRGVDNIVAALEHTDRVCQIHLSNVSSSDMEIVLAAMQQPFPELTKLFLWSNGETAVVPDSFLGGSAPRLEHLVLSRIPFPGLPNLLLSATHLVFLQLFNIPHSGYFPADALATVLSTLTGLRHFNLGYTSPRSCPDRESRRPPPSTRSVLPVLTEFLFQGVSEYLEDLVSRIDVPRLKSLDITFFNDIVFDTPLLIQFISRIPKLKALERADIYLQDHAARVNFSSKTSQSRDGVALRVEILCKGLDWQLSSLEQVCTSCLPPLPLLGDLYFDKYDYSQADWKDNIDNELWVELFRPFSAVKNLYLREKAATLVARALQELVEGRTTEFLPTVLPTLQNIFVEGLESSGPVQEGIGQFVAARQVTGHRIAVSRWTNF
jgi:hypothetical protein